MALGQCHEEVFEGHVLTVDRHGDLEVEPVLAGLTAEGDDRGIDGGAVPGDLTDVLDLDALDHVEGGEQIGQEVEHGRARHECAGGEASTPRPLVDEAAPAIDQLEHPVHEGDLGRLVDGGGGRGDQSPPSGGARPGSDPVPGQVQVVRAQRVDAQQEVAGLRVREGDGGIA